MASISETGHAKNVANFEKLIAEVVAFGENYKPSKENIKSAALNTHLANAKAAIAAINTAESIYKNAVSAREFSFVPFGKLITRVNNAIKASDTTSQEDESALTIIRKLQGRRATAKLTEEEKKTLEEKGEKVVEISSSQMSYDSRLANFGKLIQLLISVKGYNPNEEDLKVESLTKLFNELTAKNTAVLNATIALNTARIARNEILYSKDTGMVDISVDVKNYIKSVYGTTSPQYKLISSIKFNNYN